MVCPQEQKALDNTTVFNREVSHRDNSREAANVSPGTTATFRDPGPTYYLDP